MLYMYKTFHIIIALFINRTFQFLQKILCTEWKSQIPDILWKVARWQECDWIKNVKDKDWNTWFPTFFLSLFSALLWALKWWSVLCESKIETTRLVPDWWLFSFLVSQLDPRYNKTSHQKTGALWGLQ